MATEEQERAKKEAYKRALKGEGIETVDNLADIGAKEPSVISVKAKKEPDDQYVEFNFAVIKGDSSGGGTPEDEDKELDRKKKAYHDELTREGIESITDLVNAVFATDPPTVRVEARSVGNPFIFPIVKKGGG